MKSVLLVGCGGYGAGYVNALLDHGADYGWKLAAIADPYASASAVWERIRENAIPLYDTPEDFYKNNKADVAIIATPIMLHARQAIACLRGGSDVLLEKPITGSSKEAEEILRVRDEEGRKLMLGFQWCANDPMLALKRDADAGRFGRLLSMKALVLWPRDFAYFNRGTRWAGKKYSSDGTPIFDSIASNATAHYLYNMLWLAGEGYAATDVTDFRFAAAKANDIETYDTVILTAKTTGGASLFFGASHAISRAENQNPIFVYRFEKATAYFSREEEKRLEVIFDNGERIDYGLSDNNALEQKIPKAAAYFDGTGENFCPAEGAVRHITLLEKMWENCDEMPRFREEAIVHEPGMVWVKGLADVMQNCYKDARLPKEGELSL